MAFRFEVKTAEQVDTLIEILRNKQTEYQQIADRATTELSQSAMGKRHDVIKQLADDIENQAAQQQNWRSGVNDIY